MQSELTLYMVKCHISLESIYTLVSLINDKNIPLKFCHMGKLVIFSTKINSAFEILQAHKFNKALRDTVIEPFSILLTGKTIWLSLKCAYRTDKC